MNASQFNNYLHVSNRNTHNYHQSIYVPSPFKMNENMYVESLFKMNVNNKASPRTYL